MKKTGLVLEGGSFRGIFTAGVLDTLLENDIAFPYVVGVSAGSGNGVNFIARQHGRTKKVITHENAVPYYGFGQMRRSGKMLNLDTMIYDYAYTQIPFDFNAFLSSDTESEYVVANCQTGCAEYLSANGSEERLLQVCKASCSVPMLCKPEKIDDGFYLDGSVIDSIPFEHAFEKGCDKVVVVLTRKDGETPTDYGKMRLLLNISYRDKYPRFVDALLERRDAYEEQMKKLLECEKSGRALVIRPEIPSIGHFEGDAEKINAFYRHGHEIMEKRLDELKAFLDSR